jgi:hypothetical protein
MGPSGFQRHDRAGRYLADGRVSFLRYLPATQRIEVNRRWGPIFDRAPASWGLYGNPAGSGDPEHYLADSAFADLERTATLNGADTAADYVAGLCSAVFAWPYDLLPDAAATVDVRLPVDDFRGADELAALRAPSADALEHANRA